jgi:hypothetical protein
MDDPVEQRADPDEDCTSAVLSDWVSLFAVAGVVGAWLASAMLAESVTTVVNQWGGVVWIENKSMVYYLLHGGALACLLAAGTLGAINGGYARLDRAGRVALWVLIGASVLWAVIAYDWREMASPAILGATGPFVWLSTLALFAGMEAEFWRRLGRVLDVLVVVTAILAVGSVIRSGLHTSGGVYSTNQYFCLLFWYGGWRCLARDYRSGAWMAVDVSLLALLGVLALWLQRRSWVIDTALLVGLYVMSVPRRTWGADRQRTLRWLAVACLGGVAVAAVVLSTSTAVHEAMSGLQDRLHDDTRSEQYRMFFSQVSLEDLVLGLGPKATYYYGPDNPEYQYFDNAYLWMAFIGGLPILVSYCVLVVRPGLKAFFRRKERDLTQAAAGGLLAIWTLVLGGLGVFSSPSLSAYSYFICLMAGLCYGPNMARSCEWEEVGWPKDP